MPLNSGEMLKIAHNEEQYRYCANGGRKLREEFDSNNTKKNGATVKQSVNNPEVTRLLNEKYPDLSAFEVYPDFVELEDVLDSS